VSTLAASSGRAPRPRSSQAAITTPAAIRPKATTHHGRLKNRTARCAGGIHAPAGGATGWPFFVYHTHSAGGGG
jgi:hypothetical protein